MKTPRDDFWMVLKATPVLTCVVYLHRCFPLPFLSAVAVGVPTGVLISRALAPLTRLLLRSRYAPALHGSLDEHPMDSGCGALAFVALALLLYGALFAPPVRRHYSHTISSSPRTPAPPSSQAAKARSHSPLVRHPASTWGSSSALRAKERRGRSASSSAPR